VEQGVRFGVLGPLEAVRDGVTLRLGGPRPRAVLATLLLAGGRFVHIDGLVDAVWGDAPPDTAVKTVQKYISYLRAQFDTPGLIVSRADGYQLITSDVDAVSFEDLVDRALRQPAPDLTARMLAEAIDLWRGEPYADLPDLPAAQAERRRLAERRLAAFEALAEAQLALGRPETAVGWLADLVAGHPLHERLAGLLMLALYRSGRQAEALEAYRRLRETLVEELGTDPTPELRALHERILRQEDETPRRSALPLRLTSFVGRDAELAELADLLAGNRLVTLTGPAGSGKTRLAVELLANHAGTAWFVELAGLSDGGRVPNAVAAILRLGEQAGREMRDILAEYLEDRHALLVLDNCEHLLDGVADLVSHVLGTAGGLRVLATSRQPLGVPGEHVLDVPPLTLPASDKPADIEASDAVRLLAQRARAADGSFALTAANAAAVARIARRLDGMPLALELAAPRLRVFEPERLADLLDDRFRVLVSTLRTAPARHQTLRAAVAWSYDLLGAHEQALFRALSVFEGGFTLEAAGWMGDAVALLPALVERSLVVVDHRRYRLLETLREYGRAQLDPDESHDCHERHLRYCVDFAERAATGLYTARNQQWLRQVDAERDNMRAALRWSRSHGRGVDGLRLAAHLADYWDAQALYVEGATWLREALAGADDAAPELRARALAGLAQLAIGHGGHEEAKRLARESLALADEIGDDERAAFATYLLGNVALYQADYVEAGRLLERALTGYQRLDRIWRAGDVLGRLGHLHRQWGDFPAARTYLERSLAMRIRAGDESGRAWSLWQLGVLARYEGDYARAQELYGESLAGFDGVADTNGAAHVRYSMGDVARLSGARALATELYAGSLDHLRDSGDVRCVASILFNLGAMALDDANTGAATGFFAQSLVVRRQLGDRAGVAECLDGFATVEERRGDATSAARLLGTAEALRAQLGAARPASDELRIAALRARIGAETFATAWTAGQSLDSEALIETLLTNALPPNRNRLVEQRRT
jgi:predicted ATPase/DNA-binding SARP family transcriptional activator